METNEVEVLKARIARLDAVNSLMSQALYDLREYALKYEDMRLSIFGFGTKKEKSVALIDKALRASNSLNAFEQALSEADISA